VNVFDSRLLHRSAATRRYLAIAVLIATTSAGLLVVSAFATSALIVRPFQDGSGLAGVRGPLLVLALTVASRALLAWAAELASHRTAATVKSHLRRDVLASAVRLGPSWLARRQAGELAALATRGADDLDPYFGQFLPAVVTAAVVPLLMTAVMLSQDITAGLIVAATLPLIPLFTALIGHGTTRATQRQWRTLAALAGHFLDVVEGLTTLVLFGRAHAQTAKIRRSAEEQRKATVSALRFTFLSSAALDFIATISVALVAVSVGLRLVSGSLHLGTGLCVLILAPEAYRPLRDVASQFHSSAGGVAAAEAMFAVIDAQPEAPRPETAKPNAARADLRTSRRVDVSGATLRIEQLTVRYDRATPALASFDAVVRPGEYVGITGPSGCGKTTLLWVLLGFVAPTGGRVVLDGPDGEVDFASLDADHWRSQLSWVPQKPWLAQDSIGANVLLARPSASPEEVMRALECANAAAFIADLPDGVGTILGAEGFGLSAGERQRIAVARAFLRDSPLVLLDEPTAHLDAESEVAVAQAITELARERTVIAVAHRPAMLVGCDRIVDLETASRRVPV
jgi:thiol reductant ABC exporter CydD subunit